jgi:hypothetical protein
MALPAFLEPRSGMPPHDGLFHGDLSRQLDMLLASGASAPDAIFALGHAPALERGPADAAIWFSSTSSVATSRHARAAAHDALIRLAGEDGYPMPLTPWFNGLRNRIAQALGAPDASVFLTPSAREGRALARFLATALLGRPPVEIVTAPEECGDRAGASATGVQHVVELRDADGSPLSSEAVDEQALDQSGRAIDAGEPLLVQALDISRTGLGGVSRAAAKAIRRAARGRALILRDASDFRARPGDLAADLASGLMVLVSGSRFMGGPSPCAALVVPQELARALDEAEPLFDPDLSPARFDAPAHLRHLFAGGFDALMNVGLGLRWTGALADMDRYFATPEQTRDRVLDAFGRKARAMAARREFLDVEPRSIDEDDPLRASIVPLFPRDPRGGRVGAIGAAAIRAALALPRPEIDGDAICHIGAPVATGGGAVLPLAASAPMVADIHARMNRGVSFERAMAPVWRDLDTLFGKWEALFG